jgi:TolB-like protein/DNA-binding winged helix-turn-helix (wHTH) protein/Tfp pilus assembly protein PilF
MRLLRGETPRARVIRSRGSASLMEESSRVVRFGIFEVDLRAGELRKRGARVRLQEQPFQVLAYLLERRGEIVTREELRARLWTADTFVDFDHGLNKAINKLRDALGDSAASPRFIETVARRGYRFIAEGSSVEAAPSPAETIPTIAASPPVTPPQSGSGGKTIEPPPGLPTVPPGRGRAVWIAGFAGLSLALVGLLAWTFRPEPSNGSPIRALAVLPLDSLSSDASQEYFADGMTDELIATLGQISALRVISRTSVMPYKRARKPLAEIARELDVDAIVEGTVRRADNQVRITAELIDARADRHLWSDTYQGDVRNALRLQNDVARAIATHIRVNLNPDERARLASAHAVVPEAYEAYLKGRFFWNRRTAEGLTAARDYFERAIAVDPRDAQSYSGLADTFALLGDWQFAVMPASEALPKAKAAAAQAVALDGALAEAHTSLGFCLDGFDWNFAGAGAEFQRGVELNPGYATGHHWYAWHLGLIGRTSDALDEMRRAARLDPLSLIIASDLAELLLIAHHTDESIAQSRKAIEMDPHFAFAHNQLGQAYLAQGHVEEAIAELHIAAASPDSSPTIRANLARAYAAAGRRAEAEHLLEELRRRATAASSSAVDIATIYAALNNADQAMTWLEQGYRERFNPGVLLRPGLDPLRHDPRFLALVHRVGLTTDANGRISDIVNASTAPTSSPQ